jgi:hypothetical protein
MEKKIKFQITNYSIQKDRKHIWKVPILFENKKFKLELILMENF